MISNFVKIFISVLSMSYLANHIDRYYCFDLFVQILRLVGGTYPTLPSLIPQLANIFR